MAYNSLEILLFFTMPENINKKSMGGLWAYNLALHNADARLICTLMVFSWLLATTKEHYTYTVVLITY